MRGTLRLLAAALAFTACDVVPIPVVPAALPPATCERLDDATCKQVYPVALDSLTDRARSDVEEATIRPTAVRACTSAPDCRPVADVEVHFRETGQSLVVTVSRWPDGRYIAETY